MPIVKIGALLHHSYPTLSDYIEHMNRYSSLGAEMVAAKGKNRVQFHQHRRTTAGYLHLQLFFPPRLSRRPRRLAAAPLPCGLRFVEICQGVGTLPQENNSSAVTMFPLRPPHLPRRSLDKALCLPTGRFQAMFAHLAPARSLPYHQIRALGFACQRRRSRKWPRVRSPTYSRIAIRLPPKRIGQKRRSPLRSRNLPSVPSARLPA